MTADLYSLTFDIVTKSDTDMGNVIACGPRWR